MRIFDANISKLAVEKLLFLGKSKYQICNENLQKLTGIVDFFESETELENFKNDAISKNFLIDSTVERSEYGDFQTNIELTQKVCEILRGVKKQPKVLVEPTFGKGHFIISALKTFQELEHIIGIEIYRPYVWQTKFSILEYFLNNPLEQKPIIELHHQSVFDFDFRTLVSKCEILVLGNPPWVTNSMLSTLGSHNLPRKSNFKNHTGFDAITGKGNFDIGEYISLMLIKAFHKCKGSMALLVKNAVIKNIIQEQKRNQYQLSNIEKQTINTQKEFNVSTDAALFLADFGAKSEAICRELDFYSQKEVKKFGWVNDKFVANINAYKSNADIDGNSPFEWRQGVKHDCSKIMELESHNGHFINGNKEHIELESDLIYGILKSSDLKNAQISNTRKYTIITQKKIGQDTSYIKSYYPKIWQYLSDNKSQFDNRKSSIYQGKPPFSIFGIGDYSFAPYKVAISGMYKTSFFSLVLPQKDKPIMLDDTCYFIGFDNLQDAMITQAILNSKKVQDFLMSIIFWDSKRAITKDLLSRINIVYIIKTIDYNDLHLINERISFESWEHYKHQFDKSSQLTIF